MKANLLVVICTIFLLSGCASPPLVLHKYDNYSRGKVARINYNNYYRNSYQVVIKSVDGVNIKDAGSAEVEAGVHKIHYQILNNFMTSQGTDYKFSVLEEDIKEMNFEGGYSYLIGTAGKTRNLIVVYKRPL